MKPNPSRRHRPQFLANVAFGMGGRIAQLVVSFMLLAYVVRHLGAERFSLVVIGTTVVTLVSLVQLGASSGLARQLTGAYARGNDSAFTELFTVGAVVSMALAALMAFGFGLAVTVFWSVLRIPAAYSAEGMQVVLALAFAGICSCLRLPSQAVLQAANRVDTVERLNLIGLAVRVGGIVVAFTVFAPSATLYAGALALEAAVVLGCTHVRARVLVPSAVVAIASTPKRAYSDVIGFNVLTLFDSLNYVAFMQAPVFIIQPHAGLLAAGLFGIGLQLNNFARGFLVAVLNALSPIIMSLEARGQRQELRNLFRLSTKVFLAAGAFLWTAARFLGEPFLVLWLRRDVSELATALPWFMAATAVGIGAMPSAVTAVALKRMGFPAGLGFALAGAMLAVLGPILDRASGAPLTAASVALLVFFGTYQALRFGVVAAALSLRPTEFVDVVWRAVLPSVPAAVLLSATTALWPITSWLQLGMAALAATLVSVACAVSVLLRGDERYAFAALCQRPAGRHADAV
jgi:O-antigen/teichoic acid export membrane protein